MWKNLFKTAMIFTVSVFLANCSKDYDDGKLWDEVNSLDKRVVDIENTLTSLNSDIATINRLAMTGNNGLSVSSVTQTAGGYVVTYNNGDSFTIPNTTDGRTPFIGPNDNWWIGTTDTGVMARGKDGETIYVRNGTWWVGNTDTGVKAAGTDGLTPYIGLYGHWWIGDKDTGIPAVGSSGGGDVTKDVPILGVDLFTDGRYYWTQTLNGVKTWLLDLKGKMMPVTGNDGHRPIIRVNMEGYWIYSIDEGVTWLFIYNSNGDRVRYSYSGCQCTTYFSLVKVIGRKLIIILVDGTVIVISLDGDEDGDDPAPEIPDPDPLPNPLPTVEDSLRVRLDMTGIQDPITGDWIRLYGTRDPQQNCWLALDGKPKYIWILNNSDESGQAQVKTDIVFTVDNSGSMSEEADAIARDIISWAQKLVASGLDVRFACVGYSVNGNINGAIDFCDANTLASYLNHASGTSRTMGFSGSNASTLQSAASSYQVSDECGAMAIRYADANLSFRNLANRIYVNFTDEPNQPGGKSDYSVEFFANQGNWSVNQGTVHTVYSDNNTTWTEQPLNYEYPWKISDYTGGTKFFTNGSFTGVSLDALPVSSALMNSYVIYFYIPESMLDGMPHDLKLSVLTADGHVHAERTFSVIFTR